MKHLIFNFQNISLIKLKTLDLLAHEIKSNENFGIQMLFQRELNIMGYWNIENYRQIQRGDGKKTKDNI